MRYIVVCLNITVLVMLVTGVVLLIRNRRDK
jgi:hypothetical protein